MKTVSGRCSTETDSNFKNFTLGARNTHFIAMLVTSFNIPVANNAAYLNQTGFVVWIWTYWLNMAKPLLRGSAEHSKSLENSKRVWTWFRKGWEIKDEQTFRRHLCSCCFVSSHADHLKARRLPAERAHGGGGGGGEHPSSSSCTSWHWSSALTTIFAQAPLLAAAVLDEPLNLHLAHTHASAFPSWWQQATAAGAPAAVQTSGVQTGDIIDTDGMFIPLSHCRLTTGDGGGFWQG